MSCMDGRLGKVIGGRGSVEGRGATRGKEDEVDDDDKEEEEEKVVGGLKTDGGAVMEER